MEKRQKRVFSDEFKKGAVELVASSGKSIAEVARNLGVGAALLRIWVEKSKAAGAPGGANALKQSEHEELVALRKELKQVKMERDFLEKAAAFFAKQNP